MTPETSTVTRKIVLHFSKEIWNQPIVCLLVRKFDLTFSILKAQITPRDEGLLVIELSGQKGEYNRGIAYLRESGVKVQSLARDIVRIEERCTHCGACTAVCPTQALTVGGDAMEVGFDSAKCIGCELCIPACPPRAMEIKL